MSRKNLMMGIFTLLSVFFCGGIVYGAESENNTMSEEEIIDGINNECSIDLLYEKRGKYMTCYENNYKIVEAIDNRLEQLGVEEITYREAISKINCSNLNGSRVALNPSSTVKWTSTRQTTVYRGKTYELQIIRGVPSKATYGELCESSAFSAVSSKKKTTAAQNVVGIILDKIAGELPGVGTGVTVIETVYDIYKGIVSGMAKSTQITSNITAQYIVNNTANYIYVFVKYSGDIDNGKQILAYSGNQITYKVGVQIPSFTLEGNKVVPEIGQYKYDGMITSPYYKSYVDKASANFYSYKSGNKNIVTRYDILSYRITTVNEMKNIYAPTPNSGY